MIRLATLIEQFETQFLARYADTLLPSQRHALAAMKTCRTHASRHLPVNYFLVTLTLPADLRDLAWAP